MRHSSYHAFAHRVRNQGIALWHTARHVGSQIDRQVRFVAQVYGQAMQPALRSAGYDTKDADKMLSHNFGLYNQYAQNLNDGIAVVDNLARHLGGSSRYK